MSEAAKYLSLTGAAKALDIPAMTVSTWVKAGLVKPVGEYRGRRGARVNLGPKQLRELENIRRLRTTGLTMKDLRLAMKYLRGIGHNPFSSGQFFVLTEGTARRRLVKLCDGDTAIELIGKRKGQMMIPAFLGEFEIRPDKTVVQHEAK